MAFLSPEKMREIKARGSKIVHLEEIGQDLRLLKMSATSTLQADELQSAIKRGEKRNEDFFRFLFENVCADGQTGEKLSAQDVADLMSTLSLDGFTKLLNEVTAFISQGVPNLGK